VEYDGSLRRSRKAWDGMDAASGAHIVHMGTQEGGAGMDEGMCEWGKDGALGEQPAQQTRPGGEG